MKLSLSSDGSGIVRLPPYSAITEVRVNGIVTTAYRETAGVGITFTVVPPNGFPIEVSYENITQLVGVSESSQQVVTPVYTKRYEVVDTTTSYLGEAVVGTTEASPRWRIQKLTFSADGDMTILFANGSTEFNQVWTNRASLSYS